MLIKGMSSFYCEHCGAPITDSENGYITFCPHYPKIEKEPETVDDLKKLFNLLNIKNK